MGDLKIELTALVEKYEDTPDRIFPLPRIDTGKAVQPCYAIRRSELEELLNALKAAADALQEG